MEENKIVSIKDIVDSLKDDFKDIFGEGESFEMAEALIRLLTLEDEHFDTLAPVVFDRFMRSVNDPNQKIELVRSLNAQGAKAEDLTQIFMGLVEEISNMSSISTKKKDFVVGLLMGICNAINDTEGIAKKIIQIPFEKCHPDAIIPEYANTTDSGMDIFALDDYVIKPGETMLIPTGLKAALPPGYELQVRPKSGRALKTKLRVANTPGTIDAGYRDEIKVIIENIDNPIRDLSYHFEEDGSIKIDSILHGLNYYIGKGEKFAQLVLMEVPKAAPYEVSSVETFGENRGGGFGSSGLESKQNPVEKIK